MIFGAKKVNRNRKFTKIELNPLAKNKILLYNEM